MVPVLFFIFLSIVVVSYGTALLNMVSGVKGMFEPTSTNDWFTKLFTRHIWCIIFALLGTVGTVIFGVAWLAQYIDSINL